MCFIEKINCIKIRKREDRVPDPVRPLGWIKYWGKIPIELIRTTLLIWSLGFTSFNLRVRVSRHRTRPGPEVNKKVAVLS